MFDCRSRSFATTFALLSLFAAAACAQPSPAASPESTAATTSGATSTSTTAAPKESTEPAAASETAAAPAKSSHTKTELEAVKTSVSNAMKPTSPLSWEEGSKMVQSKLGAPAAQDAELDYWYAKDGDDCYELGLKKSADKTKVSTVQLGKVMTCK